MVSPGQLFRRLPGQPEWQWNLAPVNVRPGAGVPPRRVARDDGVHILMI